MGIFERKSDYKLKEEAMLLKDKRVKLEERRKIQDSIKREKELIKKAQGPSFFDRIASASKSIASKTKPVGKKFKSKVDYATRNINKPSSRREDLGDVFFR
jgi:hypothetical protein